MQKQNEKAEEGGGAVEVKEWQDVKRVAMNAWQVLGALWGIHTNREQSRICNWFWNVAAGDDPGELFPLKQSDLSGRLEHGQGAQPGIETDYYWKDGSLKWGHPVDVGHLILQLQTLDSKMKVSSVTFIDMAEGRKARAYGLSMSRERWDEGGWLNFKLPGPECLAIWANPPQKLETISGTPAAPPEQPQGENETPWIRQESCLECDGDGCAKCEPTGNQPKEEAMTTETGRYSQTTPASATGASPVVCHICNGQNSQFCSACGGDSAGLASSCNHTTEADAESCREEHILEVIGEEAGLADRGEPYEAWQCARCDSILRIGINGCTAEGLPDCPKCGEPDRWRPMALQVIRAADPPAQGQPEIVSMTIIGLARDVVGDGEDAATYGKLRELEAFGHKVWKALSGSAPPQMSAKVSKPCSECKGTGKVHCGHTIYLNECPSSCSGKRKCPSCNGSGKSAQNRR